MDATYQRGDYMENGASFRICPETTDTSRNVRKCFQNNGTAESKISPQSALPNLSEFSVSINQENTVEHCITLDLTFHQSSFEDIHQIEPRSCCKCRDKLVHRVVESKVLTFQTLVLRRSNN